MRDSVGGAWIQGAIVIDDLLVNLIDGQISSVDFACGIVVSQSCDVQNSNFDAEPFVEIHLARSLGEINGNYTNGKNPRVIDLQETFLGKDGFLRIHASDRLKCDRRKLLGTEPVAKLSDLNIRLLANWTAKRYVRPALPDEFNRRFAAKREKAHKAAKTFGRDIEKFYIALEPDAEIKDGETYRVVLVGSVTEGVAGDATRYEAASKGVSEFAAALHGNGIEVVEYITRSESLISLTDVRQLILLDYDYISVRDT